MKRNPTTARLLKNMTRSIKLRHLIVAVAGRNHFVSTRRARKLAKSFYLKLVDKEEGSCHNVRID